MVVLMDEKLKVYKFKFEGPGGFVAFRDLTMMLDALGEDLKCTEDEGDRFVCSVGYMSNKELESRPEWGGK